jgi:PadR family transcriptional regulator AphA
MNVRTLCLGILAQHDASGYEIKKAVEEGLFAHFIDASYGSIYPA